MLHCRSQAGCINGGLPPVIWPHPTTSNWPNVQMCAKTLYTTHLTGQMCKCQMCKTLCTIVSATFNQEYTYTNKYSLLCEFHYPHIVSYATAHLKCANTTNLSSICVGPYYWQVICTASLYGFSQWGKCWIRKKPNSSLSALSCPSLCLWCFSQKYSTEIQKYRNVPFSLPKVALAEHF